MSRLYGDDLSFIHDAGFGAFAAGAASGLLGVLKKHGILAGRIVDLGCGSGVWADRLLEAGYQVHGIDCSRAMIALSRRRAPAGSFRVGSLWAASIPRCNAVTAIGECLNYESRKENGRASRDRLFRRVHTALEPGGLFIFDLVEKGWAPGTVPRGTIKSERDWAVMVRSVEKGDSLVRSITSFRRAGRLYRRSDEVHKLRLYDRAEIASQLRGAGFSVRFLRGYGKMKLPPHHVACVARRM